MSSSNTPCAACKCRRQKCTQDCVFAPHFPPDQTQKFVNVHNVYGASNIAKLLNKLDPSQREYAVNSLAYEAEYRIRDPVYGCVGLISILQNKLKQIQLLLNNDKQQLISYIGPSAFLPLIRHPNINNNPSTPGMMPYNLQQVQQQMPRMTAAVGWLPMGAATPHAGSLTINEPQQQQSTQYVAGQEQEMFRPFYQQQQQMLEPVRLNAGGFDVSSTTLPPHSCETVPLNLLQQQQQPEIAKGG